MSGREARKGRAESECQMFGVGEISLKLITSKRQKLKKKCAIGILREFIL